MIDDIWVPIGVRSRIPVELFYRLNPTKLIRWQAFFNEQNKLILDDESRNGWMAGGYVQRAVAACFSKSQKYPSEPMKYYNEPAKQTDEDEEEYVFTDADRFLAFAMAMNRNLPDKPEPNPEIIDIEPSATECQEE